MVGFVNEGTGAGPDDVLSELSEEGSSVADEDEIKMDETAEGRA